MAFAAGSPAAAHADEPTVGSGCDSGQLNLTAKSSAGEGLRHGTAECESLLDRVPGR